jgi:hypothetical protein
MSREGYLILILADVGGAPLPAPPNPIPAPPPPVYQLLPSNKANVFNPQKL